MITLEKERTNIQDFSFVVYPYQTQEGLRKIGRPLFDGKDEAEVIAKLQYAFSIGGTSREACCFAGISTDSYYRYCKNNPDFRNKIELLQTTPTLLARKAIFQALLNGDIKTARWYMERKCPQEFSPSASVSHQLNEYERRIEYLESLIRKHGIDPSF
ncbi:hypothetical protein A2188_01205 [Candidatus Woesebacteria bacterium RIFOXYA1_FULL_43_9]|uniref:Uncharacterized protein n=1 Tax=Candidatus Woesebacteria bacterium RIFOXYA1_FULL_43_9 TaxID=1802534 RepID=A0A1F8CM99_9BACT|nr:MAG: hypothetical protein A2188_01205 [Candidatus Woesebacteria bacterium RIFOXYA1_FULL_43_9]